MDKQVANRLPVNSDLLFRFLGESEYKIKLYEQTMTQQMQQINQLTEELKALKEADKGKKDE